MHQEAVQDASQTALTALATAAVAAVRSVSHRRADAALRTSSLKLVVFSHIVLSFHSSCLDTVRIVESRLVPYAFTVESTAWVLHALLDAIVDSLLPIVNAECMAVDALEDLIHMLSGSEHRDLLKRMGMTRRRLTFLRQRLWSKRDILGSLIGRVRMPCQTLICCERVCYCGMR
jgi:Mg2+ and Co2+ transporter CorA